MVRNSPSMQSLSSSMAPQQLPSGVTAPDSMTAPLTQPDQQGSAITSEAEQSLRAEPLQRLGPTQPTMQLLAYDNYSKMLLTKIATGEATPAESDAFAKYVAKNNVERVRMALGMKLDHRNRSTGAFAAADTLGLNSGQSQHGVGRAMDNETQTAPQGTAGQSTAPPDQHHIMNAALQNRHRQDLIVKEQQEMKYGTIESTWERDHNRLLDIHPANWTQVEQDKFNELWEQHLQRRPTSLQSAKISKSGLRQASPKPLKAATRQNAQKHTDPFCTFLTENPTVFHCVATMKKQLEEAGFDELSEREAWDLKPSGRYFVDRNGSSLIAFVVGASYQPGNGAAILAGHIDALTAKLKPISQVPNKAGYLQLGVAPYAGALNSTWWDRDLGIGGRVLVKEKDKIVTKLVKLDWPIARVPTLAPHFGGPSAGPFNKETQMVPIIGLENTDSATGLFDEDNQDGFGRPPVLGGMGGPAGSFMQTQPPALVRAISNALTGGKNDFVHIVNWELELYDVQPATVGGLNKDFIFAGRIDDKLCSWAALQALMDPQTLDDNDSSIIKVVGLFDDEEIGSLLRQGARGNFLPSTMERAVGALAGHAPNSDLMGRTYANSFLVSSDVTHAVNPNFLNVYLENHAPQLNVGLTVSADSNGHMTTDAVSTAILQRCADKIGAKLQVFQIRNDSRSGGTVGPMLSAMTGIRAVDAGMPQLSMHSIRATTGSLDPGLGVLTFAAFLNSFEEVDKEFQS